jgi:hypothetical protein
MRAHGALLLVLAALSAAGCRQTRTAEAEPPKVSSNPARPAATIGVDLYGLKAGEKRAVAAFLKAHADLRMATDADARSPDAGLMRLYGVYHPYFVRGEVNDDGLLDFVLAFVQRDSPAGSPWFSVVVFSGREGGGFDTGAFLEREVSLANGDLSVDRDSIVITPDTSDDPNRRYRWDAMHRQFKFVSDEDVPADTPPVSRTGFEFRVSSFEWGARS